jgi:hypothetical protein
MNRMSNDESAINLTGHGLVTERDWPRVFRFSCEEKHVIVIDVVKVHNNNKTQKTKKTKQ